MEIHASEILESTIHKQFRKHAPQVHENSLMKIIRFGIAHSRTLRASLGAASMCS
jgi:hypothetical protein